MLITLKIANKIQRDVCTSVDDVLSILVPYYTTNSRTVTFLTTVNG